MIDKELVISNLGKDVVFYSVNDGTITKRSFKEYRTYTITKSVNSIIEYISGSGLMRLELKHVFLHLDEAVEVFKV